MVLFICEKEKWIVENPWILDAVATIDERENEVCGEEDDEPVELTIAADNCSENDVIMFFLFMLD